MIKIICLFILLLGNIILAENGQVVDDWVVDLHAPHTFNDMLYRLMEPINFDPARKYPVIVSLHGGGGRGTDNLAQLREWNKYLAEEQRRRDYPCFVLVPQADGRWNTTHLQNVKDIIKDMLAVDTNRIYLLGHSMGGAGTYTFIQADPEYFAAAAPSAGTGLAGRENYIDASRIKDIPLWAFHGDQDKVVPIEGDQKLFTEMQQIGGKMKLTIFVGGTHDIAVKMIIGDESADLQLSSERCDPEPVFLKWLFAQVR